MPDPFDEPAVLRTERLVLRQITETDGPGLFDIFNDDQVTAHYAWDTFTSIEQGHELAQRTARAFRERESLRWGLVPHGSERIVGSVGYTRWNTENRFAILGYDLARPYWQRGLMTEAVTAVLRLGFEQMDLNRVEALVMAGNVASITLLSRLGFSHEGELRSRALHRGEFRDVWTFGLLRAEWAEWADGN
ncbi:MAG TPA: GNAT family protein [Streptosporangiaceae bacterium]|nr:GNAT family protein [Streptosporangiaceae bacterium]